MFVDTATVKVIAGRGGDGAVSFRHEKFVDKGGPDGGDGGRGGDVIFEADENTNTLANFRVKQEVKAEPGGSGGKRRMHGKNGEPRVVKVPVGTLIFREEDILADLIKPGQRVVVARGGDGGFGNAHFKSSTRQTPRVAEIGESGDEFEARLELKLIADVGLVGFPNVGKSTFLSVTTNARPEIADYEFTTLTPNLGVADVDGGSLLIADIPGIIEGASSGKGLGDAFLRHIDRTAVLLYMVDAYSEDPARDFMILQKELRNHSTNLAERSSVIALTRCEGLDDEIIKMQTKKLADTAKKVDIFAISSRSKMGLKELLRELVKKVNGWREEEKKLLVDSSDDSADSKITLSETQILQAWRVEKTKRGTFLVLGSKIEKFARRTNFDGGWEDLARLRDIMRKIGITREINRLGATGEDLVQIGRNGREFTLVEQRDQK